MKILYKNKYKIISFLMPIIILLIIFLFKRLFTKYFFLTSDARVQFYPTYSYLYNVMHGKASFPYTFSKGLGGSMYGAFFYGLSSPTNLLLYFFRNIELFIIISTLIKIGLSGLTMYIFLKHNKHKEKNCLIFSLAYSLSGYVILYGINIMWLDSVWLAPLVLIGIDKIITRKKDGLYIIALLTTLISNYYTGYMVVLFSIIYFFYKIYINNNEGNFVKKNIKLIIHFILITILIGGLIGFMLIPIFLESKNFSRVVLNYHFINYNYLSLIVGTYIGFGKINNPLNDFGIIIYTGTITIPLLLYYFSSKSISKKEKKGSLIVLIILLLPVIITPLSAIWHLFTFPQSFNYRYSFLLEIFIIYLAIKSFEKSDGSKKWIRNYYIIFVIISISLFYSTSKNPDYFWYVDLKIIILTCIFLLFNTILLAKGANKLILLTLIIELIFNTSYIYYNSTFKYRKDLKNITKKINKISLENNEINYRQENMPNITANNSLLSNYHGFAQFLSSSNKHSIKSYYRLQGNSVKSNYLFFTSTNTFVDTILGAKFITSDFENKNYKTINTFKIDGIKYYVQKNPYALSIIFNSNEEIKNLNTDKYKEIDYINLVTNGLTGGNENYLTELKTKKLSNKKYIIEKNQYYGELYLMAKSKIENPDDIKINYSNEYVIISDNTTKDITIEFKEDIKEFKVYTIDMNKFGESLKKINKAKIKKLDNNEIICEINSNSKVLATTIPYENGWSIYIDGKKTNYYKILDEFIGLDITEGKHEIYFKYEIPGLKEGLIITTIDLILFIVYKLKYKNKLV